MEDSEDSVNKKKLTMGRQRIEIKRIEKKSNLQVTFTKRRMGLFKKSSELSVLSGCEIGILVQSPANKMFSFGNPNVESVIRRFQSGLIFSPDQLNLGDYNMQGRIVGRDDQEVRVQYADAVRRLEGEKKKEIQEGKFLSEELLESMELHDLENYLEALEGLKNNVLNRMGEVEKLTMVDSICEFPLHDQDFYNNFLEDCSEEIGWSQMTADRCYSKL